MRIVIDVNGYYDWVPAPPGTVITQEDIDAKLVKKMSNENEENRYHMRVPMQARPQVPGQPPHHHDMGITEWAICSRMAALVKVGKPETRVQVVGDMVKWQNAHHLAPEHIIKINVHDDGPDEAVFRAALAEHGITDGRAVPGVIGSYMRATDIEKYLNTVFDTEASRSA